EFIGRAALSKLKGRPLKRRLVGMRIGGPELDPNEDVWPLTRDGELAGQLTSLAYSSRLKTNIALGLVAAEHAAIGTDLEAGTWDGPRTARVSELPFLPKRQQGDARELLDSTRA
ncbi:MAG: hypothetical protein OXI66_18935, partial [Boseongicola sp.]|nr:hypothetical protein [Boseongicola sp.]